MCVLHIYGVIGHNTIKQRVGAILVLLGIFLWESRVRDVGYGHVLQLFRFYNNCINIKIYLYVTLRNCEN